MSELPLVAWVTLRIDETEFVSFPADWWQAFKNRWFPPMLLRRWPVVYSKPYRRWHLQSIWIGDDAEEKAKAALKDHTWHTFPFLVNVNYPKGTIEIQTFSPDRTK